MLKCIQLRARIVAQVAVCALFFVLMTVTPAAHAGRQTEEQLADSVRVLLRQAVLADLPESRQFYSQDDEFEFYRWRAVMSNRLSQKIPLESQRLALLNAVDYESRRAGLEPALVLGVVDVESRFKINALSAVGARGLMQVMPFWTKSIGNGDANSLFHPRINVRFGCVILRHYLDRENGDVVKALARYNGSLGQTRYAYNVLRSSLKYR